MVHIVNDPGFGICLIGKEHVGSYYLMHHGIKGQKRGFRRWQNEDGSYTPEGYQHYKELYGWGEGRVRGKNGLSEETLQRMSGEHGYVRSHHKERCQHILEKLGQPSIEKLNELKRLEKDANLSEVLERINRPPDEEWLTVDGQLVGDYGRNYNCPNCACAFELVERGYDVVARRAVDGSNVGDISKYFVDGHFASDGNTAWTDDNIRFSSRPKDKREQRLFDRKLSKYYDDLNRTRDEVIDQFEQSIKSEGAGARGIVVVGWLSNESTKPTTCFHALNYKLEDGVVILYDTQDYDMANGCSTRYLGNFDPRELYHMRTDNLDLDESITQTVYSSGRGSK